jgi:hypothetical protein
MSIWHACHTDRIHVAVEQQGFPTTRATGNSHDVRSAHHGFHKFYFQSSKLQPVRNIESDLPLPRRAGHEVGVDRVDAYEVTKQLFEFIHHLSPTYVGMAHYSL